MKAVVPAVRNATAEKKNKLIFWKGRTLKATSKK
jgi:hypothetical protein